MTISTTLLFNRAVSLMGRQQTALAELQEKVSTGKELVRPSDSPELAVNIARIKSSIGEMDAFKSSLNAVNDRLRIEESYLDGAKDVLIKLKQLTLQAPTPPCQVGIKKCLRFRSMSSSRKSRTWLTALTQTGTTSLQGLG